MALVVDSEDNDSSSDGLCSESEFDVSSLLEDGLVVVEFSEGNSVGDSLVSDGEED